MDQCVIWKCIHYKNCLLKINAILTFVIVPPHPYIEINVLLTYIHFGKILLNVFWSPCYRLDKWKSWMYLKVSRTCNNCTILSNWMLSYTLSLMSFILGKFIVQNETILLIYCSTFITISIMEVYWTLTLFVVWKCPPGDILHWIQSVTISRKSLFFC